MPAKKMNNMYSYDKLLITKSAYNELHKFPKLHTLLQELFNTAAPEFICYKMTIRNASGIINITNTSVN